MRVRDIAAILRRQDEQTFCANEKALLGASVFAIT
jgi:hypothetical protein